MCKTKPPKLKNITYVWHYYFSEHSITDHSTIPASNMFMLSSVSGVGNTSLLSVGGGCSTKDCGGDVKLKSLPHICRSSKPWLNNKFNLKLKWILPFTDIVPGIVFLWSPDGPRNVTEKNCLSTMQS